MKSLFEEDSYTEIMSRIDRLRPDMAPEWGRMSASQMLRHCQGPLAVSLGKKDLEKPGFPMNWLMKAFRSALYNDRPYKKGLPTAREFLVKEAPDFDTEKEGLITLLQEFRSRSSEAPWTVHPIFGSFTKPQWGKMNYKHLDHHLTQFGL